MSVTPGIPVTRSSFVTVLAWIFICLAGFATLISLLQNVMFQLVPLPTMHDQMAMQPWPSDMPASMSWVFAHLIWFIRGFLLVSVVTLVAAIGLLRRHDWARRLFMGLMAFAIVYELLSLVAQWWFMGKMPSMMDMPPGAPAQFADGMRGFMLAIQVVSAVVVVCFSVLFGWIIKRLHSAEIRREFRPTLATSPVSGTPE